MPTTTPRPTPEQQKVLDRILAQRERLRARRDAMRQARAAAIAQGVRVNPADPLLTRFASFAKLHPVAVAVLLGAAALAGPSRLMRMAGVVLPTILRMRRR